MLGVASFEIGCKHAVPGFNVVVCDGTGALMIGYCGGAKGGAAFGAHALERI
jgi:hypothetical protein